MKEQLRRRAADRKALAGSGYVEALIVICLFASLLTFILSIGRKYVEKLTADQRGRAAAWTLSCTDASRGVLEELAENLDESRARVLIQTTIPQADAVSSSVGRPRDRAASHAEAPMLGCTQALGSGTEVEQARAEQWLEKLVRRVLP